MKKMELFRPNFSSADEDLEKYLLTIGVGQEILDSFVNFGGELVSSQENLFNCDQFMFEPIILKDLANLFVTEEIASKFLLVYTYPALTRMTSGPEKCRALLLEICRAAANNPNRYFIVPFGRIFQDFLDKWVPIERNIILLNFEKIQPSNRVIAVPYLTNYPLGFDYPVRSFQERTFRSVFCGNYRAGLRGGIIHEIRNRQSASHAVINVEAGRSKWIPSNTSAEQISEAKENAQFVYEPPGDTPSRKGFFDTMIAGAIPVIFLTDRYYLPFSDILDWDRMAVQLMKSPLGGFTCLQTGESSKLVIDLIESFPAKLAEEMQSYIVGVRDNFRFGNGPISVGRAVERELSNILSRL